MKNSNKTKNIHKVSPLALANALGLFVLLLHPFFHLWVKYSPQSYTLIVRMFFPGINAQLGAFDSSIKVIIFATVFKAGIFWLIGYCVAKIYNLNLSKKTWK